MSSADHDRMLRPSGAHRWMQCAASPGREAQIEEKPSSYAAEGTAAHALGEMVLTSGEDAIAFLATEINVPLSDGTLATYAVTTEMASAVQRYVDAVNDQPGQLFVEHSLDLAGILPNNGTGDALRIDWDNNVCRINDLKYGQGVRVMAENNVQEMLYGLGALQSFETFGDIDTFELWIHQPRLDHVDVWELSRLELLLFKNNVIEAVERTRAEFPKYTAGDHCRFCRARDDCAALAAYSVATVTDQFDDLATFDINDPNKLSQDQVNELLNRIGPMRQWASALEERAMRELQDGTADLPDWKIVEGRSNRKFRDDVAVLDILKKSRMSADTYAPRSVLSLGKLEKVMGKKLFHEKLGEQVVKPQGKPTLAPASDKKPSITATDKFKVIM